MRPTDHTKFYPQDLHRLSQSNSINLFGVLTDHPLDHVMEGGGSVFFRNCAESFEVGDRVFVTAGPDDERRHVTLVCTRKDTAPPGVEFEMVEAVQELVPAPLTQESL